MIDPIMAFGYAALGAFTAAVSEWFNQYDSHPSRPGLSAFLVAVGFLVIVTIMWAAAHLRVV